jgi:hypothetical protein
MNKFRKKITPYFIDILNKEYSSGWCFHRIFRNTPARISFRVDNKLVGETECSLMREDLQDQNLHPTGLCGFECIFDESFDIGPEQLMTVHINNSRVPISRIPGNQVLNVFKPERNPLFFMHIPKTAGTSFNNYIRQYFGFGKSHTHIQTTPLQEQQSMARESDFLSGHITFEHIDTIYIDRPNIDRHTIVRDPLKQLHSHIAWVKGIALDQGSEFFKKHNALVQKMGQDLFQTNLSEPGNLKQLVENLDGFQIDFFDNIQTRYFLGYRPERVGQPDCDNAIGNISKFATIGLTEKFGAYVGEFCDYYDIQQKPVTSVHNPSKVAPLFDVLNPEIRDILSPLVCYDLQLYTRIAEQKNY